MNIPGYQLGREVLVGECCSVFNAIEFGTSKTVTIKIFDSSLSSRPLFCQHVKAAAGRLQGKPVANVVSLKKAGWDEDGCYLITDYFPYTQTRKPLLTEFTIDEVLGFGLQLSLSLDQLHSRGLIHGGVSTTNLYFPNLSHVVLGMLSLQRTYNDRVAGISLDESCYLAPEFASGLVARSDYYSLGVVLYELLFRARPFTADSLRGLQALKEGLNFRIPSGSAERLLPLFQRLLAVDPDNRIGNADEFCEAAQQCGFRLSKKSLDDRVNRSSLIGDKDQGLSSRKSGMGKVIIVLMVAALLGSVILYRNGDQPDQPEQPEVSASVVRAVAAVKLDTVVFADNRLSSEERAEALYQKSRQQIKDDNHGSALMSINNALKENPRHTESIQLKAKIEREIEVRAGLSLARRQFDQGDFVKPEGNNALETYRSLQQKLDPADERVRLGLNALADHYYRQSDELVLNQQYPLAEDLIATGLDINPDHRLLAVLKIYIRQQKTKHAKQLADAEAQHLEQQQLLVQQPKSAAVGQARASVWAAEQVEVASIAEIEQRTRFTLIQHKVKLLLSSARNLLKPDKLSNQSLINSLEIHKALLELKVEDPEVERLFQQIIQAYADLALIQNSESNGTFALATIDQGLALDRRNPVLLQLRDQIAR